MPIDATPNPMINVPIEPVAPIVEQTSETNKRAAELFSTHNVYLGKASQEKKAVVAEDGESFSAGDSSGLAVVVDKNLLIGLDSESRLLFKSNLEMLLGFIVKEHRDLNKPSLSSAYSEKYYSPDSLLFITRQIKLLKGVSTDIKDTNGLTDITYNILPGGYLSELPINQQNAFIKSFQENENIESLVREVVVLSQAGYSNELLQYLLTIKNLEQFNTVDEKITGLDVKSRYSELKEASSNMSEEDLRDSLFFDDYSEFMDSFIESLPDMATKEEIINLFNQYLFDNIPYSSVYLEGDKAKQTIAEIEKKRHDFLVKSIRFKTGSIPVFRYITETKQLINEEVEVIESSKNFPRLNALVSAQDNVYKYSFTNVENISDPFSRDAMLCWNYSAVMHHFMRDFLDMPSTVVGFRQLENKNIGHAVNIFMDRGDLFMVNPTWGVGVATVSDHLLGSMITYNSKGIYLPSPKMGGINDLKLNPESVTLVAMLQARDQLKSLITN